MDDSRFVDVAIIGGGPAGNAAALTLLRYTRRQVMLIEGTRYDQSRIGETVSAALLPLLEYLGAAHLIAPASALEAYGTSAAWGSDAMESREFLVTGFGHGWHLDRRTFDASLSATSQASGADVWLETWFRAGVLENGCWRLQLDRAGMKVQVTARQVIDASGRAAAFARQTGARKQTYDRLVGVTAYFQVPEGIEFHHSTLVESTPDGWWYSVPIPSRRAIAAFMTDADLLQRNRLKKTEMFESRLAAAVHTSARLLHCTRDTTPKVYPAQTQLLQPCIGENWIAAGDAAGAFDPLSSLGIGHALASGIQAARIVHERLHAKEQLALAYPSDVAEHMHVFLGYRQRLYAMEPRWQQSPFWARRNSQPAAGGNPAHV